MGIEVELHDFELADKLRDAEQVDELVILVKDFESTRHDMARKNPFECSTRPNRLRISANRSSHASVWAILRYVSIWARGLTCLEET